MNKYYRDSGLERPLSFSHSSIILPNSAAKLLTSFYIIKRHDPSVVLFYFFLKYVCDKIIICSYFIVQHYK